MLILLPQRHLEKMVQGQITKFVLHILLPPGLFIAFIDRFNKLLQIEPWKSDVAFWLIFITSTITWATNYYFSNIRKRQAIRKEDDEHRLREIEIRERESLLKHDKEKKLFGGRK